MSNPSPGALAQLFELVGSRGLRLVADKALGPGLFGELPPPDEAYRTLSAVVQGGEGVADQEYLCRKNADGSFSWAAKAIGETTIVLYRLLEAEEADSPSDLGSNGFPPADPASAAGTANLQIYRQVRMRATMHNEPGTAGVVGEVQFSIDNFETWHPLPGCTFDFGDLSTTTEWADLPEALLAPDAYALLKVAVTGTGEANVTVSVYLDLRG